MRTCIKCEDEFRLNYLVQAFYETSDELCDDCQWEWLQGGLTRRDFVESRLVLTSLPSGSLTVFRVGLDVETASDAAALGKHVATRFKGTWYRGATWDEIDGSSFEGLEVLS